MRVGVEAIHKRQGTYNTHPDDDGERDIETFIVSTCTRGEGEHHIQRRRIIVGMYNIRIEWK